MREADADIYYQRAAAMLTGLVAGYCRFAGKKSVYAAAGRHDFSKDLSDIAYIKYARDRWLYKYGLRNVDRIVVQNKHQEAACMENYARNAWMISNCYPVPKAVGGHSRKKILWVSTIRSIKRPELFVELARAMPQFQFAMVGGRDSSDPQLFDAIKADCEDIENIDFAGFVPYSKIDTYFDQAWLVVNTSRSEGFPNTFLQAWSRSAPTVSLVDCGAYEDGKRLGYVVSTLEEMQSVIKRLMSDPEEMSKEGNRCRAHYLRHHSPDSVIKIYAELFGELMGQGP
jgi:glycosyltransferase involved in cell wall biosynthesis